MSAATSDDFGSGTGSAPAGSSAALNFRLLFESAPGLYLVLTPDFEIAAVSDAYLRATMTERTAILGRNLFDVFPDNPDDPGATGVHNLRKSLGRVIETGQPDTMAVQKYDIRRPDAEGGGFEERFWSPVNSPVTDPRGDLIYIIHRVEDVTEFIRQKQAGDEVTEALRTRSQQMEAEVYLRAQELGEANRQLQAANQELAHLYDQIAQLMAQADSELRDAGKEESSSDASQQPIGSEEMLARVASLLAGHKRLEEDLRQSQKMEAVGQLAGGIAHDFNNVLNVIVGYTSLLLREKSLTDATRRKLEEIQKAGERAASLTQQLLAFSRKQVLQPRILNLADTLREMDHLLRSVLTENVEVATKIPEDLGLVKIDPGQVQQVILNLAVNARDAMPEGGKMTLELVNAELDESYTRTHDVAAGSYVMLAVSDNGRGMTPEVRQRVFEPFFTTKEVGKGTGLGLSMVYGIVRQSGGHIWLYSEPGVGTTFKIFFPRTDEGPQPAAHAPSAGIARGNETILIVEDDPAVRALIEEILASAGYQVLIAEDGDQALALAKQHPERIHLLLTDVVLPKLGGKEIAKRLTESRPETQVLFMSGYTGKAAAQQGTLDPDVDFLQKPFSAESLCAKIRAVLGSRSAVRRILVVDDEPAIREMLAEILGGAGYEVMTATGGRDGLAQVKANPVDLVISDLVMAEGEGIEMIRHLRRDHPRLKIIAISGMFGGEILDATRFLGADATLSKPLSAEALLRCIDGL